MRSSSAPGLRRCNGSVIVSKVLLPAIVAPLVAGIAAALATVLAYRITRKTPSAHSETGFKYGQAFTASMVALAHGTSDGQKTMGVITLVLITADLQAAGTGPQLWVILAAGLAIGLGTYSGGWRIMRTMGKGIVEIETPQGAASGAATTATILASAHLGFGLSTTHVAPAASSAPGVGRRGAEVRWSVARKMAVRLAAHPARRRPGRRARRAAGQSRRGRSRSPCWCCSPRLLRDLGLSRRHQITHRNVTDSPEVLVLASAIPTTYADDPRLGTTPKPKKDQEAQSEERRLMKIDWAALGMVGVVSIVPASSFSILLASSIRLVSAAKIRRTRAAPARDPVAGLRPARPGGLLVLFGLYLIIP